jgi:hypothetical protein
MMLTKIGTDKFNDLIEHTSSINMSISKDIKRVNGIIIGGNTNPGNVTAVDKGNVGIAENFNITIYEGSIIENQEEIENGGGDRDYRNLTLEEAIGANATHESVHTEDENVNQMTQNKINGANNDIEKKPKEKEKQYIDEINDQKYKK